MENNDFTSDFIMIADFIFLANFFIHMYINATGRLFVIYLYNIMSYVNRQNFKFVLSPKN